ncbi:MAG: thioredoxin domain-containing protein [Sphingomonadales bacterium]|nr:thioredoxin domain-containing protein [Sphingomonadales bacterium]
MRILALVLGAFALVSATAPNWVSSVRIQPNGAFVMGKPAAPARLVEYLSYTCGHCAHFTGEASAPLKSAYVAKGLVTVEVRNAVRDRYDFAAALLARCGGPAKFFGNSEALFASQATWLGKASAFEASDAERISKLPMNESLKAIAKGVGLDVMMHRRGFTPAQINACLSDAAAQKQVAAMSNEAWTVRKINGTPSFLINGNAFAGAGTWAAVEEGLKAALAAK